MCHRLGPSPVEREEKQGKYERFFIWGPLAYHSVPNMLGDAKDIGSCSTTTAEISCIA